MIATIILLMLQAMGLGIALVNHGKERKFNFWTTLISFILCMVLYYYAGLFNNFN